MSKLGIITSAAFGRLQHCEILQRECQETPFGYPSAPLQHGLLQGKRVVMLTRNGDDGCIAPHAINYRANIWALKAAGVRRIIALAPVHAIRADLIPGHVVIPDQLIDFTYGREHSFISEQLVADQYLDLRHPYTEALRERLLQGAAESNIEISEEATYAVIQGPRLATLAELNRYERDGCHIIGMTGMPEAALARECDIDFACMALVTHKAAGREATLALEHHSLGDALQDGVASMQHIIAALLRHQSYRDSHAA